MSVDVDKRGRAKGINLRIQILIDICRPLRRGIKLQVGATKEMQWFPIQYERLPNFCYGCGILGHVMDDCEKQYLEEEPQQFGDWMRAKGNNRDSLIMEGKSFARNTHKGSGSMSQRNNTSEGAVSGFNNNKEIWISGNFRNGKSIPSKAEDTNIPKIGPATSSNRKNDTLTLENVVRENSKGKEVQNSDAPEIDTNENKAIQRLESSGVDMSKEIQAEGKEKGSIKAGKKWKRRARETKILTNTKKDTILAKRTRRSNEKGEGKYGYRHESKQPENFKNHDY